MYVAHASIACKIFIILLGLGLASLSKASLIAVSLSVALLLFAFLVSFVVGWVKCRMLG
jgi:hypothetical protein